MREALPFDELDIGLVFAHIQYIDFEEPLDAIWRLQAVLVDGSARPFAAQSQVAPGFYVGMPAVAGRGIDGIELRQRKSLDWIVLIHHDDRGRSLAERTDTAAGDADAQVLIPQLLATSLLLPRQLFAPDPPT